MTQAESVTFDEKRTAVLKALQSRTFARSEQLKAFLRYVCEVEMRNPSAPLTEYVIGVEVLGRPEGYSPAEDSSVRTRAYELRQKLEKLYSLELCQEPVHISIPKGTYTPQYVKHEPGPQLDLMEVRLKSEEREPSKDRRRIGLVAAAIVAGLVIGSATTWLLMRAANPNSETDPILAEAWGPLAKHEGTVLLSAATPLAMVVGPMGHDVFESRNYPVPAETYSLFQRHRILPAGSELGMTFSDNMLAVGTMNAALICANTLQRFGTTYQLLPERIATVSAMRGRNAILLGAPVDGQAISVAMKDMPLIVDYESSIHEFVVRDRNAKTFIAPKKEANGDFAEVYGLLTVKTARDADHRHIQTVLLSGITSVGVQGASEFFSSPSAMRELKGRFTKEGIAGFPGAYQVVVRCTYNNLLLLAYEYHSHRVLGKHL